MLTALQLQSPDHTGAVGHFDAIVQLPFGFVGIRTRAAQVEEICFMVDKHEPMQAQNSTAQLAVDQIRAYCADRASRIDLPLAIGGSKFQRQVWDEIARIPVGATRTYGELARRLNSAPRAIGQACGDNRLPLAIPCHRVVAASGLGGFAHHRGGAYERIKRWLLTHEADAQLRLA